MQKFQIISPVDGSVYAERSYADAKGIALALDKARGAFKEWRKTTIAHRAEICEKVINYFTGKAELWSMDLTMQMGRPIQYAPFEIKKGFTERAGFMIRIAEEALANGQTTAKSGFQRYIKKEPLGTILVLAPWNYPFLTSVNAVIPAIMAGNTVILKHAEQTALCAEQYAEAFRYAGLPDGVFQYLHMTHSQVARVIRDPSIAYVAFTGSVEGGEAVQRALGGRFISSGMELGGKDPAYVCEDADLNNSIENLVDGTFFNSGQSCCAVERIYVHEKRYEDFIDGFVRLTKQYVFGDPREKETTLGPMVRKSNADKVLKQLKQAEKLGAQNRIRPSDFPALDLPYLAPQVLTGVNHEMDVMKVETFAPVVGIMPVKNDQEAIRLMNDSSYGLTASIWTSDKERAIRIGDEVDTGTWFMNRCDYLDPELAWTGVKQSGRGVTLSAFGYHALTRLKSYHLKLP